MKFSDLFFSSHLVLLWFMIASLAGAALASEPARVLDLWPGTPPGEKGDIGEERDMTKPADGQIAGRRVMRIGNVSKPTLSIYPAPASQNTGTAVLVCPGGAYRILAWDLEGTEVCEWLNSIGITGALLKYRVPKREGLEKHTAAFQDAQRAMGLLRSRAREFGIDPQRIGVLGFSAGGHLAALTSHSSVERSYPKVDAADAESSRPNFAVLVYPGYLTLKEEGDRVAPELSLSTNTPPTFMVMTQDDPVRVENVLFYSAALKQMKVPFELHVYPSGGHGYGLRRTPALVTTWPDRVADWLRSQQWLGNKSH
ncbi:MAG: alpha/beta hydrolase [Verrucomicrobiota bacterium]